MSIRRSRFFADVTPLRESRRFRRLYVGQFFAVMGREFTIVAVPYQVYLLTESTLLVGALGIVQFFPLVATSIVGGAIVDAVDRRKLIVAAQLLLALTAVALAVNAALDRPAVWPLFLLTAVNAGLSAIDNPARKAAIPGVLRRDLLPSGFALLQTMTELGHAMGPAIAGVMIASFSLPLTFGLEAVAFVAAAASSVGIGTLIPHGGGRRVDVSSIREGLSYLRRSRSIQSCFVIDLNAMVFGMPRALFPAMGIGVFAGNAATVGLLYAAPGVGSVVGALTSGWVGEVRRRGRMVVCAVMVWGAAITLFGFTSSLPVALVMLAVAGAADVISAVFRNTIIQLVVPDQLRGRLTGLQTAVAAGGPRIGDFESGLVASVTSLQFSAVSGGVASMIGTVIIARRWPELWRYPGGMDPPPQSGLP